MLVGQFWVNAVSYRDWLMEYETVLIELYSCDDCELKLEDNKKEKDDKFPVDSYDANFDTFEKITAIWDSENFLSPHHPDITTPPPQSLIFLS